MNHRFKKAATLISVKGITPQVATIIKTHSIEVLGTNTISYTLRSLNLVTDQYCTVTGSAEWIKTYYRLPN